MSSTPDKDSVGSSLAQNIEELLFTTGVDETATQPLDEVTRRVQAILSITHDQARFLVAESERLYVDRMRDRFSQLRVSERLKRTNPFLLRIRGAETVEDWATLQIESALYASEE